MIDAIEVVSHEVAGDELMGIAHSANCVNLSLLIRGPRISDEPLPVQHQAGVVLANRDRDFAPVVVGLAPIGSGPVFVQRVECLVFCFQPILEVAA